MIHLASCRKKYDSNESHVHEGIFDHNSLKSSYCTQQQHDEFDFRTSNLEEHSTDDNLFDMHSPFANSEVDSNTNHKHIQERQGQCSTAVSKVQIKLIHLINSHKASLKLYDDVINLFN